MTSAPAQQAAPRRAGASGLHGRHVLITGATRGIGWAIAQACAAQGARLSLTGRDAALLSERRATLAADHAISCAAFAADLADPANASAMVADAVAAHGAVDVLVNKAGAGSSQPFARMTAEHWDDAVAINLSSVFHVTRAAIAGMLERRAGRIVNIASTAGLTGYPYIAAYAAAKHGVVGLTRALAAEFVASGIAVHAVCPGYVETEMTRATIDNIVARTGRSAEQARAELTRHNPQGRLIQPDEVADTVLWLAGTASPSITGQCIVVAGGEIMP